MVSIFKYNFQLKNNFWGMILILFLIFKWECKGDLDRNLEFGLLRMSCEGFDYAKDPYILDGSCGLEYTIEIKSLTNYDN